MWISQNYPIHFCKILMNEGGKKGENSQVIWRKNYAKSYRIVYEKRVFHEFHIAWFGAAREAYIQTLRAALGAQWYVPAEGWSGGFQRARRLIGRWAQGELNFNWRVVHRRYDDMMDDGSMPAIHHKLKGMQRGRAAGPLAKRRGTTTHILRLIYRRFETLASAVPSFY